MKFLILFIFSCLPFFCVAQKGKIEGKVTDAQSGKPLAGVSVIIEGENKGVSTNLEGYYELTANEGRKYSLRLSMVNYKTKIVGEIEVAAGKVLNVDIVMEVSHKSESEVVIRSSSRKETTAAMIAQQRTSPVVAQVISAETIRKSPDKNTGDVLKRVPGTSVQEGKYLVVRGLADRYNQAMLNGILLSSTEPDRKTFSYDIFPAPMIDNIVINKAFIPELPGEWAGGLIQVQTKDIPSKDFVNIMIGTGFNSETVGKDFVQAKGGKLDWLGIDDGTRDIPDGMPTKSNFANLSQFQKNEFGKQFRNVWSGTNSTAPLNKSFQANGGFSGRVLGRKIGGVLSLVYNETNKRLAFENSVIANKDGTLDLTYNNSKYSRDVLAAALANLTIEFNNNNRISFKNIININSSDYMIDRAGRDYILGPGTGDVVDAKEIGFRQNTFFNTQVVGEHNVAAWDTRVKWYAGFNILDQYIPDQRRLFYTKLGEDMSAPFYALLGAGSSQKSGSIFYSFLNDYIYNAGADISKTFSWWGQKQTIKAGYLFQVKDRLFDSRPFYLNTLDNGIKQLSYEEIFAPENFGTDQTTVQFGELTGKPFRYLANTIMNAGFLQFDNQFSDRIRVVYGVRVEDFDQLVGSVLKSDERHVHSRVTDFLPGLNFTYKLNPRTNIRVSGSQTVARPEFRELSPFAFYDFELNAQVVGNSQAKRTKISNFDLRYEVYPRSGELVTLGVFYKHFNDPIEYYFNRTGPATNTFNISNSDVANVYGSEFEFRKKLDFIGNKFRNFTLSGNLSYIYSKVSDTAALHRPLQGQSPYLINFALSYDLEKAGFSATALFNQIGRRILYVGNEAISDIWENPRPLLDLQLSKKILKNKGEIKLNISDIINRKALFYHDLDDNHTYKKTSKDVLAISRNYGTNYSLSFAYSIR
jgi:hypothetical protein